MRRPLVAAMLCLWLTPASAVSAAPQPPKTTAEEAFDIGMEAYVYLYPLVTMDVTRLQMTNIEPGRLPGRGPANAFSHMRAFPAADMKVVVRPNFDTLYSSGWLDLTRGPVIVSAPDTGGRYYLLPMIDMWTDVFAVPGKRTSGTAAADFAVVPPGWKGTLPAGVQPIQAPTPYVWVVGRTQTNGVKDYEAVHRVQDGYRVTPLSQWSKPATPAPFRADPAVDMKTPPLDQVNGMSARKYFAYGADLMRLHAPHVTDWSTVERMKRIGLEPGRPFSWDALEPAVQQALDRVPAAAIQAMAARLPTLARVVDGWQMNTDSMGVYGNFYLKRAIVAMIGLGANQPQDAIYPLNVGDADGRPLRGENSYVLHFSKDQLPPVEAFWSLTMYDADGFQVANPIDRFAIGDRDALKYNADGSLDLYIQHANPGPDRESNWLPAPASGTLGITMRLYAPRAPALDGRWSPPPVRRADARVEALPH